MSELFERLRAQAQSKPTQTAIVEGNTHWTYADVTEKAIRLSAYLSHQGIQPGDRVGLMLLNQKEWMVGFFAVRYLNAVVVPINVQLPSDDIAYVIENAGIRLLITISKFVPYFSKTPLPLLVVGESYQNTPSFEAAIETGQADFTPRAHHPPENLSVLIYTSGTTARPKGVMLSEENLLANLAGFADAVPFEPSDKILMALPLFHAYGLIVSLYGFAQGLTQVLVPTFNPRQMVQTIATEGITILPLVPTIYSFLAETLAKTGPEPLKSLRMCISGGASLPAALLKHLESAANLTILEGYGLTETSPVVAVNRMDVGSIPGSVGQPLKNLEVRLVDWDDQIVPSEPGKPSTEGEVQVKGPSVMMGYYHLPEETSATIDADGWLKTGDIGHFDEHGNLYLSGGRKKELIIKAGENISPLKIESVLYQHPSVAEACVFGVADPKLGEDIAAAIRIKEDESISDEALRQFCVQHLTPFMVPRHFKQYSELPKNAAGKILRKQLKAEWEKALAQV